MSKTPNPTENQESSGFHLAMKVLGTLHRWLYRASGGKLGKTVFGSPVLLLTTIGRKTGRSRTWPLTHLREEGNRRVVAAAYGGLVPQSSGKSASGPPARRTNPSDDRRGGGRGREVTVVGALIEAYPAYVDYQRKTGRQIPVVVLRQEA
jgi:F420H(2)-dependent quinone reductase